VDANQTVNGNWKLLASLPVPDARFGQVLFGFALLVGLTAIGGCGGSQKTLTPGSYTYMLTATEQGSSSPITATATLTVTVPPGIVVKGS
jgi:hypothetical protein